MKSIARNAYAVLILLSFLVHKQGLGAQREPGIPVHSEKHPQASFFIERDFHDACTSIGDALVNDVHLAMRLTNQTIEKVGVGQHREWMHVLLTLKYSLAQSAYSFLDSVGGLAERLRQNAGDVEDLIFRESMVYVADGFLTLSNVDSARKYVAIGEAACRRSNDSLNLAIFYVFKGKLDSTANALEYFRGAEVLSEQLSNRTAYLMGRYYHAHRAYATDVAELVGALEKLVELSKHPSLVKTDFRQTFFVFPKPTSTIYLDLLRLNLVLMDVTSARRIHTLIENFLRAHVGAGKSLSARSQGMLLADKAVIEAFAGNFDQAAHLLDSCHRFFPDIDTRDIPSVNYFLARTLLEEANGNYRQMLTYAAHLRSRYAGAVLPLSRASLLAHAYALNGDGARAAKWFQLAAQELKVDSDYSAKGYFHYQHYAKWLLDKGDYPAYVQALTKFYNVKDSIANINHLRDIAEIEARHYVKEREVEIDYLTRIREAERRATSVKMYGSVGIFVVLLLVVFVVFSRYRQKKRYSEELREKNERIEVLNRELHHRVKNNLQMVGSLLSLQSLRMKDGEARLAVEDGQRRVETMALIHHRLYRGEDVATVDMNAYLGELATDVVHSHSHAPVDIEMEIANVRLGLDIAVPLGLIVNELLTNSLKHGRHTGALGKIKIEFRLDADHYRFGLSDDGPGFPTEFQIERSHTFGLNLVGMLVRQLKAKASWGQGPGAHFELVIPIALKRNGQVAMHR